MTKAASEVVRLIYAELPALPQPVAPHPSISSSKIEARLDEMRRLGFDNDQRNFNALCCANFQVDVAACRLLGDYRVSEVRSTK